jgi:hypothetical protein
VPATDLPTGNPRAGDAPASPVAEAIGVSKRFGASQALRDVSVVESSIRFSSVDARAS